MAGGGTTTTTTEPWIEQQDFLEEGFGAAKELYKARPLGPAYYGGPTLAGFDPAQQASQRMAMNYAMGTRPQDMQRQAEASLKTGLSGQVDTAAFNPLVSALSGKVQSELQGNILPGIRESLVRYQPGGSSRGDLVQNKAIANAVTSGMTLPLAEAYGNAYNTAQQRATQAAQQYPSIMGAPLGMAEAVGEVGEARRGMTQEGINRAMARDQYTKNAPQQALANYMSMIGGNYGGTTTQTAPSDPFGTLMSLGSLAGGLGWAPFSDIRVKENIVPDGTTYKGHNVYHFNYVWDDVRRRGVMAQEVEQTNPDAVVEIDGIKHVAYGAL